MGKQFKEKKKTGNEYVSAAKKFHQYTVHTIQKMPTEMKNYILDPLFNASYEIERNVVLANAVYIDKDDPETYQERVKHLITALRAFNMFDVALDNLVCAIDLQKADKLRLKNILEQIILEGSTDIKVVNHINDIEYESVSGNTKVLKTAFTTKNKDYLLLLETTAKELVSKRISADRTLMKAIQNKAS